MRKKESKKKKKNSLAGDEPPKRFQPGLKTGGTEKSADK